MRTNKSQLVLTAIILTAIFSSCKKEWLCHCYVSIQRVSAGYELELVTVEARTVNKAQIICDGEKYNWHPRDAFCELK